MVRTDTASFRFLAATLLAVGVCVLVSLTWFSKTRGQAGCVNPPQQTSARGWAQNSSISYRFSGTLSASQQNNLRSAFASWNSANGTNRSGVSFYEFTAVGPVQFDIVGCNTPNCATTSAGTTMQTDSSGKVTGATTQIDTNLVTVDLAFLKTGLHETGHTMGLGDQPGSACGGQVPQGSVMNGWCGGPNDPNNNMPTAVTTCDNGTVSSNPIYPPPPPPPSSADCQLYGCACGGTCMKDGTCTYTYECSPILIAVGENADIQLTSAQDGVWFDMEATGTHEWVAWTRAGEPVAFLARDINHNGLIDDGSELFGNHTLLPSGGVAPNGFYALAAYDQPENGGNGDGVIDSRDAIWSDLLLWIDWNHNGVSEHNELYRLEDLGLTQISLQYQATNRSDQFGNVFRLKAPCQLAGKVRFGYDVYFSARPSKK